MKDEKKEEKKPSNNKNLALLILCSTPIAIGLIGLVGVLILGACPFLFAYFVIKLILDKIPSFRKKKKKENNPLKKIGKSVNNFDVEKILNNVSKQ